jgi:hypothetical protein
MYPSLGQGGLGSNSTNTSGAGGTGVLMIWEWS